MKLKYIIAGLLLFPLCLFANITEQKIVAILGTDYQSEAAQSFIKKLDPNAIFPEHTEFSYNFYEQGGGAPEIERSKVTDVTMTEGFTWNIGLFLNLEMGLISVEYDWHGNHNYGWRSYIGLTYILPLQELLGGSKSSSVQNW